MDTNHSTSNRFMRGNLAVAIKAASILAIALVVVGFALGPVSPTAQAATGVYIVNTTDDVDGGVCNKAHCSLREAINAANAHPAADIIEFNIPGESPFSIQLLSALPEITDPVMIDGTTQPGYADNPIVELDGTDAGEEANGLVISAGDSTVKGLVINRFSGDGIVLTTNGENTIQGNFIGTDASGTEPLGNLGGGVGIFGGAADNTIGGTESGAGNLISGNIGEGVRISDPGTTGNTVQGNFIGTDVTGSTVTGPTYPDPGDFEVTVDKACPTYPAGTEIEGWVSESDDPLAPWSGISVLFTGTDECGSTETLGEASLIYRYKLEFPEVTQLYSVVVSGGNFNGPDNVLRVLDADGNVLGATTTFGGIPYLMLKGVSGNVFYVEEFDTSNEYRFRQSIVVNGPVPLGNQVNGVAINGGASDNLIGGAEPTAKNIISGNVGDGLAIYDSETKSNKVQGNFIGTDVTGMVALGNLARGVVVFYGPTGNLIGGTGLNAGNLISGNELAGIGLFSVGTEGNQVQGNLIGTDITGMNPLGNGISGGFPGIRIGEGAADNLVGGTEPGEGNTIAFNAGPGIALSTDAGSGNSLLSNLVFSNGEIGIDLGFDGVTPNDRRDPDRGPNDLQNYPVIHAVTPKGESVKIHGTFNSTPNTTFRLEFFSNEACDPSGYGEGQVFLGFADVTTNRGGNTSFNFTSPVPIPPGVFITATATDPAGSTSEFSNCANQPAGLTDALGNRTLTNQDGTVTK